MQTALTVPPTTRSIFPLNELTHQDIKVLKQIGRAQYPDGTMDLNHPIDPHYTQNDDRYATILIRARRRIEYTAITIDEVALRWQDYQYIITHFRNRHGDHTQHPLTTIRRHADDHHAYSIEFAYEEREKRVVPIWIRVDLPHIDSPEFPAEEDIQNPWNVYYRDSFIISPELWE